MENDTRLSWIIKHYMMLANKESVVYEPLSGRLSVAFLEVRLPCVHSKEQIT